uniref:Nuclear RNA export factor 1 n=1 Tax=Steinernema glaseri TaxID=37863 RepID=A0A1I8A8L5_9BILA
MSNPNFSRKVPFQDAKVRSITKRLSRIPRFVGQQQSQNKNSSSPRQRRDQRREQNEARIQGGNVRNKEPVFLIKFMRAGRIAPDSIYKAVSQRMVNFRPYLIGPDKRQNLVLYVTDEETAEALQGFSKRLCDPANSNFRITIIKNKTYAPWNKIPAQNVEIIKRALQRRFNEANLSLDLTDFSKDELFTSSNLIVSLARNDVMIAVADIIDEHYGSIKALSLKNNGIKKLDYVANLIYRAPKVRMLDLSNNHIEHQSDLKKLKGWNVETLFMENCPIATQFTTSYAYVNAVHEVFPTVTCLDGVAVTRAIDITERRAAPRRKEEREPLVRELPPLRGSFLPNSVEQTLTKFAMEYFSFYDGENGKKTRQKLFDAYDEDATFTYVQENMYDGERRPKYPDPVACEYYRKNSHNVLYEDKWTRYREKIVRQGRMAIAAELSQMPLTTHIKDSFVLDVFSIANFVGFNIQGLFRDGTEAFKEDGRMNYFSRTFIVLPREEGKIVVVNDQLTVSAISDSTRTRYKNLLTKVIVSEQATEPAPVPSVPQAHAGYDRNDPNIQEQMVAEFCRQSGLKPEWSRKCLEEFEWNYEAAGNRFLELKDQIPAEAFQ